MVSPYGRSSVAIDDVTLGSSYSLSHGNSSSKQDGGSSGHSWFGWLKGDSSSSSRERSGDQGDGGLSDPPPVDKPRNEHEEVQVCMGISHCALILGLTV